RRAKRVAPVLLWWLRTIAHGREERENVKRLASRVFGSLVRSWVDELGLELGTTLRPGDAVAQKLLMQQYRLLAARGNEYLPSLEEVGFRVYSQFEEDGILLY